MAQRREFLEGVGEIILQKRRGTKHIRLSVQHGLVRVSMPHWTPYAAARTFVIQKLDWITSQLEKQRRTPLMDGGRLGKSHRLVFEHDTSIVKTSSRLKDQSLVIKSPRNNFLTSEVQRVAEQAGHRVLKREAERLLPARVAELSRIHQLSYNGVVIKRMRSRWGSCSNQKKIALNVFLMQLPWELIDYVILHELVHTKHMDHSTRFWNALEHIQPRARELQKQLRSYQPVLMTL